MDDESSGRRQTCYRVAQTVSVMWSLFMVGISDSLLGPSMLDLQALLQVDLGHLNYIVMATGLVDFLGAVLAGFLARTAGVDIRIAVSLLLGSVGIAISAAMPNYFYVLVAFSTHGFLRGIVYCFSIEKCNGIWTNKGVSFQLVGLGPTIGGAISPLIINLFLCEKTRSKSTTEGVDTVDSWNRTQAPYHYNSISENGTAWNRTQASYHYNSTLENGTAHDWTCLPKDIRISYAYIVLGAMCIPPVLAFFVFWMKSKRLNRKRAESKVQNVEPIVMKKTILEILFCVLFVVYYFPLLGGSILFSTFLVEFGVKGPLGMEKAKLVLMSSLYWGSSCLGRVANIILTPLIGVQNIIIVNLTLLLVVQTLLVAFVSQSELVLWISTCAIGIFISPHTGAAYAWFSNQVRLDPKIIGASGASLALGAMLIPFLGGLLFQHFGPMYYLYFFFGMFIFAAVVFFILYIISRKLQRVLIVREVNVSAQSEPLQ